MCDCREFEDLSAIFQPLLVISLPKGTRLFHGGALPIGKSLQDVPCGMWLSTDSNRARQYACFGANGSNVALLEVELIAETPVFDLVKTPLGHLRDHYGPYLPSHRSMNRDMCCTFDVISPPIFGAIYNQGEEIFLCKLDVIASICAHQAVDC